MLNDGRRQRCAAWHCSLVVARTDWPSEGQFTRVGGSRNPVDVPPLASSVSRMCMNNGWLAGWMGFKAHRSCSPKIATVITVSECRGSLALTDRLTSVNVF